jgi:hypothetical protein
MLKNREETGQISNEKIDISDLLGEPFEYTKTIFPDTDQAETVQISNEKIDVSHLVGEPYRYRLVSFPAIGQADPISILTAEECPETGSSVQTSHQDQLPQA